MFLSPMNSFPDFMLGSVVVVVRSLENFAKN